MRRRVWGLVGGVVLAHGVLLWAWLADAELEVATVSLVDGLPHAQGQVEPTQGGTTAGTEQGGVQVHDARPVARLSSSVSDGHDGEVGLVRKRLGARLGAKQGDQSVGVVDGQVAQLRGAQTLGNVSEGVSDTQGRESLAGGVNAHVGSNQSLACDATHKALSAGTGVDVWVWVVRGAGANGARFERAVFSSEGMVYGEELRSAAARLRFVQVASACEGVRLKVRVRVLG